MLAGVIRRKITDVMGFATIPEKLLTAENAEEFTEHAEKTKKNIKFLRGYGSKEWAFALNFSALSVAVLSDLCG
jgi:hypothetical protein